MAEGLGITPTAGEEMIGDAALWLINKVSNPIHWKNESPEDQAEIEEWGNKMRAGVTLMRQSRKGRRVLKRMDEEANSVRLKHGD